jgi:hypothetical protein
MEAGARLWPLPNTDVPGHDDRVRLRPPKLATMTEDRFEELIYLLAEMLSSEPEPKAFSLRPAA